MMRELLVDIRQIGTSVPMGRVARRALRPSGFAVFEVRGPGRTHVPAGHPSRVNWSWSRTERPNSLAGRFYLDMPFRCGSLSRFYEFSLAG